MKRQIDPVLFDEINNAVLDLQKAHRQTFSLPLKNLSRLLHSPELQEFRNDLVGRVNFDDFLAASEASGSGMSGSKKLIWPETREEQLGIVFTLVDKLADDENFAVNFGFNFFYSGSRIVSGIHNITSQIIIPFARDLRSYVLRRTNAIPGPKTDDSSRRVFIVHGHDEAAKEAVARFLERAKFEVVILHEQASRGMTIAEKLEKYGDVGFAVVLLTADDVGRAKVASDLSDRARQNVVLELGYFIGRLGRERVSALKKGEVEIPSDYMGVVYTSMDANGGWKADLAKELIAAGYSVDWNLVMA